MRISMRHKGIIGAALIFSALSFSVLPAAADLPPSQALSVGSSARGTLAFGGENEEMWYRVAVNSDGLLTVVLRGENPTKDFDLEICNESMVPLVRSEALGSEEERCEIAVGRGQAYYIRAYAYGYGDRGGFTLETSFDPAVPEDWHVIPSSLEELTLDDEVEGFASDEEEAWYHIHVEEYGSVLFTLMGRDTEKDLDLEVYRGTGELLGRSENAGSEHESIDLAVDVDYDFFVRVFGYAQGDASDFVLTAEYSAEISGSGPTEVPDVSQMEPLSAGGSLRGEIISGAQKDWYVVEVPSGGWLRVTLEGDEPEMDLDLEVYDSSKNYYDASTAIGSYQEEVLLEGGYDNTYCILVYPYTSSDLTAYTLSAAAVDGPSGSAGTLPEEYTEITLGEGVSGAVSGGSRWYRVYVEEVGELHVSLEGSNDDADLDMRIYDELGELMAIAEEVGSTEEAFVDASTSYYFYIEVYPYNEGETSRFTLTTGLRFSGMSENVEVPEDAPAVRDGRDYHGSADSEDGVWFKYTAVRGGLLAVYLAGPEEVDLDLSIYDKEGNHIRTSNEYEALEAVLVPIEAGKSYFIRVYPYQLGDAAVPFVLWTDAMRAREPRTP